MLKTINKKFIALLLICFSTFAFSEVYQCEIDGKQVFQQVACPVVNTDGDCDASHDYSDDVDSTNASFSDRYCYYLQLENVEEKERLRLLQAYKQKRDQTVELVKREKAYNKLVAPSEQDINGITK